MNTTHTFPAGIAVGIGRQSRRFGRAMFAVAALIVVVAVAVVTLAIRSNDTAPAAPHVPATWNTPNCPLHGLC